MRLWWSVFCVVLSGCVPMSVVKDTFYPDLAELELYRQGDGIFCTEPAFLECAGISLQECSAEGRRYTHECILSAKAGQGEIEGQAGAEAMIEGFSSCMADRMLAQRNRPGMEDCMKEAVQE